MFKYSKKYVFCIVTTIFFFALVACAYLGYQFFAKPLQLAQKTETIISIANASSAYTFSEDLQTHGLVHNAKLVRMLIRMRGLSNKIKAGIYVVHAGESINSFLSRVAAGDVLVEKFVIIAGTTQAKISQNLQHSPYLIYNANDWLTIADNHQSAEGQVLADTYFYQAGSRSSLLLAQAHAKLQTSLMQAWNQRSPGLPFKTPYELLIAASILEKEASLLTEKKLIAGVMVNRLRKHIPLQMDPTTIYALGSQYRGKLSHADLQVDSPYNTYHNRGLPPGPIAMVGVDAIFAAAHPTNTGYYYFVAKGDGSHQFSATYDEQRQAIARFAKDKK